MAEFLSGASVPGVPPEVEAGGALDPGEHDATRAFSEGAALAKAAAALLDAVEQAIGALDEGTYGRCRVCGDAIDEGRLAASASEQRCGVHAESVIAPDRLF